MAQAASLCLKFALVPVMTRLLSPADFGIVTACMAIVAFLSMVGGRGGWSAALVVHERDNIDAWRSAYSATLGIACLLALGVWVSADHLSAWIGLAGASAVLRALAALIPVLLATEFLSTFLISRDRYRVDAQAGLAAEIIAAVVAIAAALAGWGAWALVLQQALAQAIRLSIYTVASRLMPTWTIDFEMIWKLTPYAFKSTASEFVNFVGVQGPTVLVARGLGAVSAGLYGVSVRVTSLPGDIVMQSLARILVPAFVKIDDAGERAKAVIWSSTANSFVLVPVLLGFAAVAEPLCRVMLGREFSGAAEVMIGLAIGKALTAPCAGFYSYLKAVNRMGVLWWLMTGRSCFIVAGTLAGMHLGGAAGAGWGFACAAVPTLGLYCAAIFRLTAIGWVAGLRSFLLIVGCSSLMAVAAWCASEFLYSKGWSDITNLTMIISASVVIYSALMAVAFRTELKRILLSGEFGGISVFLAKMGFRGDGSARR